jgi:hypothetical protein
MRATNYTVNIGRYAGNKSAGAVSKVLSREIAGRAFDRFSLATLW